MDISVTIPVYNEAESIALCCEKLQAVLSTLKRSYEILLVDDGSTDRSWDIMREMAGKYPGVRLIRFGRNFGQTAAMSAGFRESRGDIIITMDADLQNDPADIPKLLAEMDKGCDVVSGWRKDRKDAFLNRRLPSMLANALISRITGVRLHDYGCTLKAYRRSVMKNVHLYGQMHRFIPALARWVGGSIREVEVGHHARQFGKSKYGINRTTRVILDLMVVKFLMDYGKGPIQIFGKLGLLLAVPGLAILLVMMLGNALYWIGGWAWCADLVGIAKRPFWIITPFVLIIFGIQSISIGLLAELLTRTYHESQDKPIYFIKETVESK